MIKKQKSQARLDWEEDFRNEFWPRVFIITVVILAFMAGLVTGKDIYGG